MNEAACVCENDVLHVALLGHLLKVRLAQVLPHPMTTEGLTPDDHAAVHVQLAASDWCGFEEAAIDDGVRVHAAFASAELTVRVERDGNFVARRTVDGFTFTLATPRPSITIELSRQELWDLPPHGPKLICFANLHSDEHAHAELLADPNAPRPAPPEPAWHDHETDIDGLICKEPEPEPEPHAPVCEASTASPPRGDQAAAPAESPWISLTIATGKPEHLKVISIFPHANFAVYEMHLKDAVETMKRFLDPGAIPAPKLITPHLAIDDVMDTDGIVRNLPHGAMGCVGANNMAVIDELDPGRRMVLGFRTHYQQKPHGLVFPNLGDWQAAEKAGLCVFPRNVPNRTLGFGESRRTIIRAFSWVEGPFDSINTYDHENRLSWGVFNWISNLGAEVSGAEMSHVLAYIHENYPDAFTRCFAAYGFSVWFEAAKTQDYRSPEKTTFRPYSGPRILFPGCHGPNLRAALTSMRTAVWQNHRSLYATWVFRMAGHDGDAQRAQVEIFNLRIQSAVNHLGGESRPLSERAVAEEVEHTVNPNAGAKMRTARRDRITAYEHEMHDPLGRAPGSFIATPRGRPFKDPWGA